MADRGGPGSGRPLRGVVEDRHPDPARFNPPSSLGQCTVSRRPQSRLGGTAPTRRPHLQEVGISYVEGTVRGPTGTEASVRFLIDSGATYSLLPEPVWRAIGLRPNREMDFVLADG